MNVEYINPFISVSVNLMKMVCNETASRGKVFIKNSTFASDNVVIIIGVAGEIKGQVFFSMNNITACNIASTMMFGTEVKELDDMAKSAIAELGNMIMGNVSTEFFNNGIKIDITPPTVLVGKDMALSTRGLKTICIPLLLEKLGKIEIDVALTEY
ncbi:MAG TPA: chemotaxis protein CheX [Bacillota bacterium]|nr:chemotaxis protein CheX [Bacillota bacterium]HQJ36362.1 chemotaxis protein CheX [Bacillota bacterium]HQL35763.1 chemotaxis protein CheX [Bacillota bacterium]HRS21151.1 chemotaxis protein CheX [Clostridia bacterium]